VAEDVSLLYAAVTLFGRESQVKVVIEDDYDHVAEITKDGYIIQKNARAERGEVASLEGISLEDMVRFAAQVDLAQIAFLLQGAETNKKAALAGLESGRGSTLGLALWREAPGNENKMWAAYAKARAYTAAAAEARMSGMKVPITAVAGSGNHGITALLGVLAVAEVEEIEQEKLARALSLCSLVTIYIKSLTNRLTAFCGCGAAAATGVAAAITWLLGGNCRQIGHAMQSVIGSITGMICDGAKESCAFKVSVAAGEAVLVSYLSLMGSYIHSKAGIVAQDILDSMENLGKISDPGMKETDKVILEIIRNMEQEKPA
ncbi:MAG TPA: serine dehydratase subunit alpha family protein, partial [Clostridia bacterium]|nr:serine dehydratase subunit alpha family protein [Clostridia bacterium]